MSQLPLKPANRLDAEDERSAAEQQIREPGPRHAAVENDQSSRARSDDGEPDATVVAGDAPNQIATAGGVSQPSIRPAPNSVRLLAFLVDLLLVTLATVPIALAVSGSMLFVVATLLLVFVVYHTAAVWLTGGKTIGKALCNLSVGHLDGSAPAHDAAAFAWAFGRASVGYLVVDMFGLGVLVALRNPQRRCLHDYVFRSQVVTHLGQADPQPRSRLAAALSRLRQFSDDLETTLDEAKKNYMFLLRIWKWLVELAAGCLAWLLIVGGKWRSLLAKLSGHATATAPAKALSAGKTIAVASGTAIATSAGFVAVGALYLATSIVGDWGNPAYFRVERVGLDTYQTRNLHDDISAESGCAYPRGEIDYRLHGRGSHFTGSELWSQGTDGYGQNCTYAWGPATFDLLGKDTLKVCSTAPMGDHRRECATWVRTPKQ